MRYKLFGCVLCIKSWARERAPGQCSFYTVICSFISYFLVLLLKQILLNEHKRALGRIGGIRLNFICVKCWMLIEYSFVCFMWFIDYVFCFYVYRLSFFSGYPLAKLPTDNHHYENNQWWLRGIHIVWRSGRRIHLITLCLINLCEPYMTILDFFWICINVWLLKCIA